MRRPAPGWLEALPAGRLMVEFSLWSADLMRLGKEIERIEPHADLLHVDVADGHFAPALLFFPDLVKQIRARTPLPIHVHLMAADEIVLDQIGQFAEAGADLLSIHLENTAVVDEALEWIRALELEAGLVVNVETPVDEVAAYLDRVSFVTLLGTRIGVKGKGLERSATARMNEAAALIGATSAPRRIVLAADGGIREHTVPLLRAAGAETVVGGSLVFEAADLAERVGWLRGLPKRSWRRGCPPRLQFLE